MFNPFKAAMPTLLGALTVAAACIATPAHAGLMIKLQSGATTYTQSGPSPLVVVQSIGNFTTTVNTGTATLAPSLDLSSVDINSSSGGTLIVTVSADGFTAPFGAANWLSQFSGNFVFGAATVTQQTYLDNTNTLLGTGTLLSTLSASTTPFAMSQIIAASTTGLFALTEVLTIVTTGAAHLSLDASIVNAPEPASLTLLGLAVIGVGTLARRKRPV